MAKELPYFKFYPNEWNSGMIQLCSMKSRGLFLEICSIYWSRLGDLPYRFVVSKVCGDNEDMLTELKENSIFEVSEGGYICIDFLDEQLKDFKSVSKKRSKAAKKRWSKEPQNNESKKEITVEVSPKKDIEANFMNWFNGKRKKTLNKPSNLKALSKIDKGNLHKLRSQYNSEDFNVAYNGMIKHRWAKDNNAITPTHFLRNDNFNRYFALGMELGLGKSKLTPYEEQQLRREEIKREAERGG